MAKKRFSNNPDFVKVGVKALSFSDPYSGLSISRNQVAKLDTHEKKRSGKIRIALRGGHLEAATEKEYNKYLEDVGKKEPEPKKPVSLREKFEDQTKAQLTDYYKDNYKVGEEDITAFSKLKHDEMVEELLELEDE